MSEQREIPCYSLQLDLDIARELHYYCFPLPVVLRHDMNAVFVLLSLASGDDTRDSPFSSPTTTTAAVGACMLPTSPGHWVRTESLLLARGYG